MSVTIYLGYSSVHGNVRDVFLSVFLSALRLERILNSLIIEAMHHVSIHKLLSKQMLDPENS